MCKLHSTMGLFTVELVMIGFHKSPPYLIYDPLPLSPSPPPPPPSSHALPSHPSFTSFRCPTSLPFLPLSLFPSSPSPLFLLSSSLPPLSPMTPQGSAPDPLSQSGGPQVGSWHLQPGEHCYKDNSNVATAIYQPTQLQSPPFSSPSHFPSPPTSHLPRLPISPSPSSPSPLPHSLPLTDYVHLMVCRWFVSKQAINTTLYPHDLKMSITNRHPEFLVARRPGVAALPSQ